MMKGNSIAMVVVLILIPLFALQAQTERGPQQYFVKLIRYNVAKIKWDDIEQYGPFSTQEEAGRVAEETLRSFPIIDGYSTEIIQDAAPGKDGVKRIDEFHPFNIKIPELIVSKTTPGNPETTPADPATLKKNFVMWLEQEKNGKWEAVPNRRFEYSNMTVKDFQKKLETYKTAVASENKKAIRLAAEKVAQKQGAGRPVRYQVKWDIAAEQLAGTTWRFTTDRGFAFSLKFKEAGKVEWINKDDKTFFYGVYQQDGKSVTVTITHFGNGAADPSRDTSTIKILSATELDFDGVRGQKSR
jgi:hypothetical protein